MMIAGVKVRLYAMDGAQPALGKRAGLAACLVETDVGKAGEIPSG